MKVILNDELKDIILEIKSENKSDDQWSEIESSDMFQNDSYCGGYDTDEAAFCFSYFNSVNREYWFQFSLKELDGAINGEIEYFEGSLAN